MAADADRSAAGVGQGAVEVRRAANPCFDKLIEQVLDKEGRAPGGSLKARRDVGQRVARQGDAGAAVANAGEDVAFVNDAAIEAPLPPIGEGVRVTRKERRLMLRRPGEPVASPPGHEASAGGVGAE